MNLQQRNSDFTPVAARTDYAVNSGDADWSEPYSEEAPNVAAVQSGSFKFPEHWKIYTGICYEGSEIDERKVTDGLSKTYMVGEKYLNPDHYSTGRDPSDDWSMYSGHQDDNHRVTHPSARPKRDRPGLLDRISFGSAHANIFQIAMCDGSVRAVSYEIDATTHRLLGHIHDGLPTESPD
jgi:hypothetical protein